MSMRDDDLMAQRRAMRRLIEDIDAEIREESTPEYQAERAHEAERRRRWGNVPSSRTPQGVPTQRMTEEQMFRADRERR